MMVEDAGGATRNQRMRWALLSGFGLAGGLATGLGLAPPIEALVGMMLAGPIVLGIAGSALGTSQSLAMGRLDRPRALWIGVTAVGFGTGMTLGVVAVETVGRAILGQQVRLVALSPFERFLGLVLVGSITGLVVGLAQQMTLRRSRAVARRWVSVCLIGFGVGLPGGGLAADVVLGGLGSPAAFGLFLAVAGLITGLVTASEAVRVTTALDDRGHPTRA